MALLQLPKEYSAGFRDKFQKPAGPLEIDYDNPIAKGLVFVYIADPNICTPYGANDAWANDANDGVLQYRAKQGGLGFGRAGNTGSQAREKMGWKFVGARSVSDKPNYTVFHHFHQTNWGQNGVATETALYVERPNSTQIFKTATASHTAFTYVIRNASNGGLQNRLLEAEFDTTKPLHSAMFAKYSDENRRIFADHNSASRTTWSAGTYNACTPQLLADPIDQNIYNPRTTLLVTYTFDRALSEVEYRSLRADPYQLLKPARPTFYFTADVPSGTINKMKYGSNSILDVKYYNGTALVDVELQLNGTTVWKV